MRVTQTYKHSHWIRQQHCCSSSSIRETLARRQQQQQQQVAKVTIATARIVQPYLPGGIHVYRTSNTRFPESTRVNVPNGIPICSAVFAQFTVVTNTETDIDEHTDHDIRSKSPHPCTECMRCGLIIIYMYLCSCLCGAVITAKQTLRVDECTLKSPRN